jgi:uncharacterized membrane protein (UPF0127 family)
MWGMRFVEIIVIAMLAAMGCGGEGDLPSNPSEGNLTPSGNKAPAQVNPSAKADPWDPDKPITHAQPKLRTLKLNVGFPPREITAEMAISQQQIATGMMHRKKLEENEGMLFVFPQAKKVGFYMRNTTVPLTAAYLGSSGVIMELHDLEPLNETPVEAQSELVRFVLEMPRDWFKVNGVTEGQKVIAEKGKLLEVFFPSE